MLDSLRRLFGGGRIAPPALAQRRFDGGVVDRLTASWVTTNTDIDRELRGQLNALRARSRDLFKNNEFAAKFGRMVRNNVVGPEGFILQARTINDRGEPDSLDNQVIEAAWWRWMRPGNCEVSGRYSFTDLCRSTAISLARDGEFLLRKVRGNSRGEFGYQLQILDIERLDTLYNREATPNTNAIIMGVEVDSYHAPIAYHLFTSPGVDGLASRRRDRIPAADIIHGFIAMEPEQTRGVPWLHAAMRRMNDLNGYREAAVIAARIGASKMGIYTSADGSAPPNDGEDADGNFIQQVQPGEFSVAPVGYKLETFNPTYPHDQFDAFCKAALRGIASGIGVSYNGLANDLEGVNYSSIRAGVLDERDEWMVIQNWLISTLLDPIFEDWLSAGLLVGAITNAKGVPLPISKLEKFRAHAWQGRRWSWVDPEKDISASILAINNRLASPQQIAAQAGRDIEDILDDIAAFEKMAAAKGVETVVAPAGAITPASPPIAAPTADAAAAKAAMGDMVRSALEVAAKSAERPIEISMRQEPMHITVQPAENHVHLTERDAAPAQVTVNVEPTPMSVNVAAPAVTIEPAQITVELEATMPTPEIRVELPSRRTETTIQRDGSGRITSTSQIEQDA